MANDTEDTETFVELQTLPSPPGLPLLGNLLQIDPSRVHLILEEWAERYGSFYHLKMAHQTALVVSEPQVIAEVLRARPDTFRRFSSVESVFADMGMTGLLSAEGEQWHRQRKLTMRAFDPTRLRDYFPNLIKITERLRQRWLGAMVRGQTVDIQSDLMSYSVDVTAGLAFGSEINSIEGRDQVIRPCLDQVFPIINRRLNSPVPYWRYFKLPSDRALDRNMAALRREVDTFIANARARMKANPDLFVRPSNLIEAFLAVRDLPDSEFTDDDVYGNVFTTLLVGPDSTANVFSWLTYFLCANPEVQNRVQAEASELLGVGPVLEDFAGIAKLKYLDAVASETMRLKPSGPILFLEAKHETRVGHVRVLPGTAIIALTRVGGMAPHNVVEPLRFDPGRWMKAADADQADVPNQSDDATLKRIAMPFGAGARLCPGRYLALVQIKMLGAMLGRNFRVERVDDSVIAERFKFSMEPVNLRVKLSPR